MNRQEANAPGIVKDLLRAVAVVDVEIGDQDSVEIEAGEGFGRGQGDVGVDAKPHSRGRPGVMARRADQTERPPVVAAQNERDRLDAGTGRELGRQARTRERPRYRGRACRRPRLPARSTRRRYSAG